MSFYDETYPLDLIYTLFAFSKFILGLHLHVNKTFAASALYFWGFSYGAIRITDPTYYQGNPLLDDE